MNMLELEELGLAVLQLDESQADDLDELMFEKFEVSFGQFCSIAHVLLDFTPLVQAGLSGKTYHAFVSDGVMIIKKPIKDENDDQ